MTAPDMTPVEEYERAARAWALFCKQRGKHATIDGFHLLEEPLAVVLLAGIAEPAMYSDEFTGDLIADVLRGLRAFIQHLDDDATEGGGGRAFLYGYQIESIARKLDAVLVLRSYERERRAAEGGPA